MNLHLKLVVALAFVTCCTSITEHINAQNKLTVKEITAAVDAMFVDRAQITTPGAVVTIVQNDEVLLSKYYGGANLAFGLPFDEHTVFPLVGFTDQLVVFSILQLEKKKRIQLDDPINAYLPELGFSPDVTLSHLLNHSSGFPDLSSLRLMAGWNYDDPIYHDDFIGLTKKYSSNLSSDVEFRHSHSGIKVLQMVVEKVEGRDFAEYVASNIFDPLNMTNSSIGVDVNMNTKDYLLGYEHVDSNYVKVIPVPYELDCPNTYTTQLDFQKWMINAQTKTFEEDILERMDGALTLNGKTQARAKRTYCLGQQLYWNYGGQNEFYWTGTEDGFSWKWTRLMPLGYSILVVGNLNSYIGTKVNAMVDLFLDTHLYDTLVDSDDKLVPIALSNSEMESFTGHYWDEEYYYSTKISIVDGELYHSDKDNGFNFALVPRTKNSFYTPFGGVVSFTNIDGSRKLRTMTSIGLAYESKAYTPSPLKAGDHLKYEGLYFSDKLKAYYRVVWEDDELKLKRSRKSDLVLTSMTANQFRTNEVDFRLIKFSNHASNSFRKMSISNTVIEGVEFVKLPCEF